MKSVPEIINDITDVVLAHKKPCRRLTTRICFRHYRRDPGTLLYRGVLWHLAQSIGSRTPDSLFGMFTSYHDAAGGSDHGFIVVTGWLSTIQRWQRFECDWRLLLAKYELPYFHMKEFVRSKGPFTTWKGNEPKRSRFLSLAVDIIKSHVEYGQACFVEFDVFRKVNKIYALRESVGIPYSFAGRSCVAKFNEYLRKRNDGTLPKIDYVFEDGDRGKGLLMEIVHRDCGRYPIFYPSRNIKHKKTGDTIEGMIQLQASDFSAYELRKAMKDDPHEEWLPWEHRKSLQALAQINGQWGRYSEEKLFDFCKNQNIPRRGV